MKKAKAKDRKGSMVKRPATAAPRQVDSRCYVLIFDCDPYLEHLVDHVVRLCAGLDEEDSVLVGVGLRLLGLHLPLLGEVELVAAQSDHDGRIALALKLLDPEQQAMRTQATKKRKQKKQRKAGPDPMSDPNDTNTREQSSCSAQRRSVMCACEQTMTLRAGTIAVGWGERTHSRSHRT